MIKNIIIILISCIVCVGMSFVVDYYELSRVGSYNVGLITTIVIFIISDLIDELWWFL